MIALCQHIYLTWTECNWQCHHSISHYWNVPSRKYDCHLDSTLLHMSKISKPVCFELSSNMHSSHAFGNHIYSLLPMTMYALLIWQTSFVFCIHDNNFGYCTHVYNAHEVLSWQPQMSSICKPYLIFHIYDSLRIPCLEVIFFANTYDVFIAIPRFHILQPNLFFHI